jgi:hypothetical protein
MLDEYRSARGTTLESVDAAWRDLEAAGAERPSLDLDSPDSVKDSDQKLKDAVEQQLAFLKRKLGKEK